MPYSFDFSTLAVIPSALGPLQALIAILPHLLVILGTALVAISKPKTYRSLIKYCWAHKGLTALAFVPIILFFVSGRLFSIKAVEEKSGSAWTAFRGGPERIGAVAGAHGPSGNARVLWNYIPVGTGAIQAIDSSPTIVGNRAYFGVSIQTPFKKSGSITCLDTDTGTVVWQFTGEGMNRPLQPVFSSPAIGGTSIGTVSEEPRYLVSGEGYHVEQNSRILCLDLDRVRKSGGKQPPEFKWAVPTTSHVESSSAIFENKVYVGAGDDGWWCIDLESGKVLWRLEGNDYYVLNEGPQVDAIAKLAGKTVAVSGAPKRYRPDETKDFSIMFLDASNFVEVQPGTTRVPDPAQSSSTTEMRTVIGKVVVTDAVNNPEQKGSRVKIEMEKVYPDAECPPVALRIAGQPRLICGSGMDGQAVICIDAETGKEIWRTKTSDPVFSAPTVVGEQIVVGLSNGTYVASSANPAGSVVALSATDGKQLWQYKTTDGVLGAVAVRDGKAYATARDGNLYVIDVKDGKLVKKFDTGAPMVCSPSVTDSGVYVCTQSGKVFGIRRDTVSFQWSLNLTPGQGIISSPGAAGNRLFIGSATRGLFCLGEETSNAATRKPVAVWAGPGGNAGHTNVADEGRPPSVDGNKSDRIDESGKITSRATAGPTAACGASLYFSALNSENKPVLACVDTRKRREVWQSQIAGSIRLIFATETNVYAVIDNDGAATLSILSASSGQMIKASSTPELANQSYYMNNDGPSFKDSTQFPAVKTQGLLFITTKEPQSKLLCRDDGETGTLWSLDLPAPALSGASVSGGKIFIALSGKGGGDAKILCRNLVDGSALWETEVEKAPATSLAVNNEHVAYTAADGTVIVLDAMKGEQTHTILLGKGGQAPVLYQDTLFLAAENRVGAYALTDSTWLWGYRDQKTMGRALAAPILCGEAVWISTEKQGLIAIGGKEEKK